MRGLRAAVVAPLVVTFLLATAPVALAERGLTLGFADDEAFTDLPAADVATNLEHAKSAGASVLRVELRWSDVAPKRPPSPAVAADPGWSGYRWDHADEVIRAIARAGMRALPVVVFAPRWAEGPGRPAHSSDRIPIGSWRPSATALRAFATAVARRYSGSYPDPRNAGIALPRVKAWQVWNEPNLTGFLAPQWQRTQGGYRSRSPGLYRDLLNAFYAGMKAVAPSNTIVTAGTSPFGDLKAGDSRMQPARFWRDLLCVTRSGRRACSRVVRFDVAAHHPYTPGSPRRKALNADDISMPDLAKITTPLARARRLGTVRPNRAKPLWVTEVAWDSRPDPDGLTLGVHAHYLAGAMYVLWRSGVDTVLWWRLRDDTPDPSFAATFQSGVFMRGATPAQDKPKPALQAYRFPFAAYFADGVARLWGKAPGAGVVTIEVRKRGRWERLTTVRPDGNRVFLRPMRVARGAQLRARLGDQTSVLWNVS